MSAQFRGKTRTQGILSAVAPSPSWPLRFNPVAQSVPIVRDPEFRTKPPKVQEAFVGTNHETLRKVYDEVTPDDLRAAMGFTSGPQGDANREREPRVS